MMHDRKSIRPGGFTLIELLVVLAIVATLLSLVAPNYIRQADRAKEAALKENLAGLRTALDQFYSDKGQYPEQLAQLVEGRYLRKVPIDPITGRSDTWKPVVSEADSKKIIVDIASGAAGNGMDGTPYHTW